MLNISEIQSLGIDASALANNPASEILKSLDRVFAQIKNCEDPFNPDSWKGLIGAKRFIDYQNILVKLIDPANQFRQIVDDSFETLRQELSKKFREHSQIIKDAGFTENTNSDDQYQALQLTPINEHVHKFGNIPGVEILNEILHDSEIVDQENPQKSSAIEGYDDYCESIRLIRISVKNLIRNSQEEVEDLSKTKILDGQITKINDFKVALEKADSERPFKIQKFISLAKAFETLSGETVKLDGSENLAARIDSYFKIFLNSQAVLRLPQNTRNMLIEKAPDGNELIKYSSDALRDALEELREICDGLSPYENEWNEEISNGDRDRFGPTKEEFPSIKNNSFYGAVSSKNTDHPNERFVHHVNIIMNSSRFLGEQFYKDNEKALAVLQATKESVIRFLQNAPDAFVEPKPLDLVSPLLKYRNDLKRTFNELDENIQQFKAKWNTLFAINGAVIAGTLYSIFGFFTDTTQTSLLGMPPIIGFVVGSAIVINFFRGVDNKIENNIRVISDKAAAPLNNLLLRAQTVRGQESFFGDPDVRRKYISEAREAFLTYMEEMLIPIYPEVQDLIAMWEIQHQQLQNDVGTRVNLPKRPIRPGTTVNQHRSNINNSMIDAWLEEHTLPASLWGEVNIKVWSAHGRYDDALRTGTIPTDLAPGWVSSLGLAKPYAKIAHIVLGRAKAVVRYWNKDTITAGSEDDLSKTLLNEFIRVMKEFETISSQGKYPVGHKDIGELATRYYNAVEMGVSALMADTQKRALRRDSALRALIRHRVKTYAWIGEVLPFKQRS